MTPMILVGAVLVIMGMAGVASACQMGAEDRDMVVAVLAGLSFAIGLGCLALGAARHGYHRRPLGSPPGDMDPDKARGNRPDV